MRSPWGPLLIGSLLAVVVSGCTTRASERESDRERERGHQREEGSFTLRTADDWNDAAGRVVNHVVASVLP